MKLNKLRYKLSQTGEKCPSCKGALIDPVNKNSIICLNNGCGMESRDRKREVIS